MRMFDALCVHHELKYKKGDIGIEVEMEGRRLPTGLIPGWMPKHEGSLRGEAMEYVLDEPCREDQVEPLLEMLWGTFAANKTNLWPSNRCSVHVHINVQRLTEVQTFNLITLYLIAEDALVRWCGEGRVGNLFCLRARDAEFVIDSLEETSVDGDWSRLHTNDLRYSALNCKALGDFGSLEFRSLRGTDDPGIIKTWVSMLLRLREAALRYDFPSNILDGFSAGGEEAFCREVFGDHFEQLFDYEGWREDVRSGMRRCQCIAYSGNWVAMANNDKPREQRVNKPQLKKMRVQLDPQDMRLGAIQRGDWVVPVEEIPGVEWRQVDPAPALNRVVLEKQRQQIMERERMMRHALANLNNRLAVQEEPDEDE